MKLLQILLERPGEVVTRNCAAECYRHRCVTHCGHFDSGPFESSFSFVSNSGLNVSFAPQAWMRSKAYELPGAETVVAFSPKRGSWRGWSLQEHKRLRFSDPEKVDAQLALWAKMRADLVVGINQRFYELFFRARVEQLGSPDILVFHFGDSHLAVKPHLCERSWVEAKGQYTTVTLVRPLHGVMRIFDSQLLPKDILERFEMASSPIH
jgi:hypothetical protein